MEETCFPRGGTKPKRNKDDDKPRQKNLFNVNEGKKRKKPKSVDISIENVSGLHLNSVDLLAYNKIQPSMVILGCVKEVLSMAVKVQLPATLYADVQINAISDKLTNQLVKNAEFYESFNLKDMFQIGNFIPIQILENGEMKDGRKRLIASVNPININHQNNCNSFRKGMLIWGSISERSDHVYSVDLGVQNTRCILDIKDIDEGKEFVEGQPLWLSVKKVQSSNSITTIMVTHVENNFNHYVSPVCNLEILCPGSCVEVTCTKVLKNGLEVTFFNDCTGYINKIYLDSPQRNLMEFLNTSFKAYVLYKNPITKFTYFTTKPPHSNVTHEYDVGDVLKSKVIDRFPKGVLIKFENSEVGFVTFKRLISSLKAPDNADIQNLIKAKYSKGSTYDCRIMDYSYMDQMYICTFEMDIIKEKYFSRSDLKVGEIVVGKIKSINKSGIVVKVGMMECFATNEHLTNVLFSENVKLQYKVGKTVKARVLSVDSNSIRLTLKPALLEDHECLSSYKQAKVNHSYLGVVVFIKEYMALITFYNDVKGIVLDKEKEKDFTRLLYQGQVIMTTVVSKENERMLLSIGETSTRQSTKPIVGEVYNATISNITHQGLEVVCNDFKGFVPVEHLCADLKLSKLMIDFLKKDHELFGLLCLKSNPNTDCLFSIRENLKSKTPKTLKPGSIVRSIVNAYEDNLNLNVFTKRGVVEVNVDKNDITDNEDMLNKLKFTNGQSLLVKITTYINNNMCLGTVRFSEVFHSDYNYSAVYLQKYLDDLNIVYKLSKGVKAISEYKIGQKVDVRVKKITSIVCSVELKDGTIGIAIKEHMPKNLKIGSMHTVRILFANIGDNVLEVSFKPQIVNQKYVEDLDLKKDQKVFAKILLVRENLAVCSVKYNGKKSFGFCPIKLNENDFSPDYGYYESKSGNFKFVIYAKTDFGVIGFPSDLLKKSKQNSRKRKLSESNQEVVKRVKKNKEMKPEKNIKKDIKSTVDNDELLDDEMSDNENESISNNDLNNDVNMEEESISDNEENVEKEEVNIEKPKIPVPAKFKNPSITSFFDTTNRLDINGNSDSESDADIKTDEQPKKKKMTKKEQVELLKKEEEKLRQIELAYADMNNDTVPQTADQFDRRLLAEPNSSVLWIQYAALHISNTEIDKARTVFRRALQSINHTLTEDHFNVWTAYINLEHMYGTKQTFTDVFNEAVRYNDDLKMYIHAINTLSDSQNIHDVDELVGKMVRKFKQEEKMYVEIAKVYYKQKRFVEARKLRSKALATVMETKKHIPLIIQFAKLEFLNGEDEYAETLFETILKDTPQRTDVWTVYVDQLIKKDKIDSARRVLQRAVSQKLKLTKMTTLCKKYVAFEKLYGDEETRNAAEGILNEIFSTVKGKY